MAALTAALIATAALTAGKTALDASAAHKGAKAAKKLGEFNAQAAEDQARDAITRGEEEAGHVASQAKLLTGAQRASIGASGVDITSGSAVDVMASDQRLSALDILAIKHNAAREAHGFQVEAQGYRMAGANQARAYTNQMYSTLIGGASDLFETYSRYGINKTPRPAGTTGAQGTTGGFHSGTAHY